MGIGDPNIKTAFESFLNSKNLNEKTMVMYNLFFDRFFENYPEINQQNIDTFLMHYDSAPARAMIKNLIRAILRWEFPEEFKRKISIIDIPDRTRKEGREIPKFINKIDLDRLDMGVNTGDKLRDERFKLILWVQFYAGLRLNEVMHITYNDLLIDKYNKEDKYQTIKIKHESAKFGKERNAYIPTEVYIRLMRWLKLWIANNHKELWNKESPIWDIGISSYKQILHKQSQRILGIAYNTHSLRHGRGYDLKVKEKKDVNFIKKYLGHADIRSTQIYTHLDDSDVKNELEGIN